MLNFLKVLWEGAAQYSALLERVKNTKDFWKWLSSSVTYVVHTESNHFKTSMEEDARTRASRLDCQAAILELMAYDIFLQRKLSQLQGKVGAETKVTSGNFTSTDVLSAKKQDAPADVLLNWSKSSAMQSLVKLYSSCDHDTDIETCAKVRSFALLWLLLVSIFLLALASLTLVD